MSKSTTREVVEVDADSDVLAALQQREPEKSAAELVDAALQHYLDAHEPWIALDEADRFRGDA